MGSIDDTKLLLIESTGVANPSDLKKDLKTISTPEMRKDLKKVLRADLKQDLRKDIKPELRKDLKRVLKDDLKQDLREDIKKDC